MRTGTVCLLLAALLLPAAPALADEAKKPAEKPEEKPEDQIRIDRDGTIEAEGRLIRYWQVNHVDPGRLGQELMVYSKFLGDDVQIQAQGPKNILRIEAVPEKWPLIEELLDVLDVPEPQVFVEAKIIEIRHDSNLEFGVEALYDRRKAVEAAQPFFGSFRGNFNPETYLENLGTSTPFQGGEFDFRTVGSRNVAEHGEYSYIVRALQERGSAEILSKPSIIATQGKKATITTGEKFPVSSVSLRGSQTTVSTKFEQTGIKLEITPTLVGREAVTLEIFAEDSQVIERIAGPEGSQQPVISTRSARTQVNVRDEQTIIIGGLLTNSTIESKTGLPFFSDIPLLGYLFSATRTREVKAELIFFITPRIIKRQEASIIVPPGERRRRDR